MADRVEHREPSFPTDGSTYLFELVGSLGYMKLLSKEFLVSPVFLGLVLFVFSAAFPPFDDAAEVNLTLHMTQHVLVVLSGVLIAYPYFKRGRFTGANFVPWGALALSGALLVFWHIPSFWDSAVINPAIHVGEHASFLVVGMLAGSQMLRLPDSAKIGALLAAFFGHMAYAVILISQWKVYSLYSVSDQNLLGWALLLTGPSLIGGVAYVVARNPNWLSGFSDAKESGVRRKTFIDHARVPRWVSPAIAFLIVAVALGYVVVAAAALYSPAASVSPGVVVVQIVETPVSWQYSPQHVHLVIGVNSTMVWWSRSISYESVTSRSSTFDSGPIAPGQTYRLSFTEPGTYDYYCVYHPWMSGEIVVSGP